MIQRMKGPAEHVELPMIKAEVLTESPSIIDHLQTQLEGQIRQGEMRKGYPEDLKVRFGDEDQFKQQMIDVTPGL